MSYSVLEYKIQGLATIRIGANGKIGLRLNEYEARMPGADHYVDYRVSHKGTIRLCVDKLANGMTEPVEIYAAQTIDRSLTFKPVVFEQPNYFFEAEFEPDVKGLDEDSIAVWHYLEDFTSHFMRRGRVIYGQYSFNTEPGDFRFEVRYRQGGLQKSIWIEFTVAATKMDVKTDYRNILKDIESWDREQVFSDAAKTLHSVAKSGKATDDDAVRWIVYFDAILDHYESALKRILYQPHQHTVTEPCYNRLERVRNWNPALIRDYARCKGDSTRLVAHRFADEVRTTTVDTMENRFVKRSVRYFADILKKASDEFAAKGYDAAFVKGVKERHERMQRYLREPMMQRVGDFVGGGHSLVLQMRPGYADIRIVWEKLTSIFSTDISLGSSASVGLMRLSALYEFWCFITVKSVLDGHFRDANCRIKGVQIPAKDSVSYKQAAKLVLAKDDEKPENVDAIVYKYTITGEYGLPRTIAELVFQQTYDDTANGDSAYSAPYSQRPDIVLQLFDKERTYTYIFDAKYQVDDKNGKDVIPKISLDKMHCYRDAILWRTMADQGTNKDYSHEIVGAYILYPADPHAYPAEYDTQLDEQNVGAIPLLPNNVGKLEKRIKKLIDSLDINAEKAKWLLDQKQVIPQRGLYYTEEAGDVAGKDGTLDLGCAGLSILEKALGAKKYPVPNKMLASKNSALIRRLEFKIDGRSAYLKGHFLPGTVQDAQLRANGISFHPQGGAPYYIFEIG